MDNFIRVGSHLLLDETKQMLVIHGTGGMNVCVHFSDIVKVSVWHTPLFRTFQLFIQQHMQLKMGLQEGQTPIAECLQWALIANPSDPVEIP
jgi:hypothetical protein